MPQQSPRQQPPQGIPSAAAAEEFSFFRFVHDLRGPLNVVTVYAELLQTESGTLTAKQKHYAELIKTGAEELEREIETYLERLPSRRGDQ